MKTRLICARIAPWVQRPAQLSGSAGLDGTGQARPRNGNGTEQPVPPPGQRPCPQHRGSRDRRDKRAWTAPPRQAFAIGAPQHPKPSSFPFSPSLPARAHSHRVSLPGLQAPLPSPPAGSAGVSVLSRRPVIRPFPNTFLSLSSHPTPRPNPALGFRGLCNGGKKHCSTAPSLPNIFPPWGCFLSSSLFSPLWQTWQDVVSTGCQQLLKCSRRRWLQHLNPLTPMSWLLSQHSADFPAGQGYFLLQVSCNNTAGSSLQGFFCLGHPMTQSRSIFPT